MMVCLLILWTVLFSAGMRYRVFIRDTSDEVECGNSAGVKTIGCTWGYQSKVLIEQANPTAIVDNPQELMEAIILITNN